MYYRYNQGNMSLDASAQTKKRNGVLLRTGFI